MVHLPMRQFQVHARAMGEVVARVSFEGYRRPLVKC